MASADADNTSAPTWPGAPTITAGGARARSSFIWTATNIPTICGTGTEDYFCGSYNFDPSPRHNEGYITYTTPYAGFHQVIRAEGDYKITTTGWACTAGTFSIPIRFDADLRVTMQALGWGYNHRYLPLAR